MCSTYQQLLDHHTKDGAARQPRLLNSLCARRYWLLWRVAVMNPTSMSGGSRNMLKPLLLAKDVSTTQGFFSDPLKPIIGSTAAYLFLQSRHHSVYSTRVIYGECYSERIYLLKVLSCWLMPILRAKQQIPLNLSEFISLWCLLIDLVKLSSWAQYEVAGQRFVCTQKVW